MKRHLAAATVHGEQGQLFTRKNITKVFGQRADVRGLGGVRGIVVQQRAVILHYRTAAARGHYDGLRTCFDVRPPGVDVAAHEVQRFLIHGETMTECATTTGTRRANLTDAEPVQHPRRCCICSGRDGGLHAAVEHQHLARMARSRPRHRRLRRRYFFAQRPRQNRPQSTADGEQRCETVRIRNQCAQHTALHALAERARHFFLHHRPADVDQPSVPHARRTGGYAGAAGETADEMQLGYFRDRAALQHLLDEIYAAARTVEFITKHLIGRTSSSAITAMHAGPQDGIRLPAFGRIIYRIAERRLHSLSYTRSLTTGDYKVSYIRTRLYITLGSKACFTRF